MIQFIQHLINALNVGSIYALVALGYTMVYGIIKLINFAHGDILMMGAYFGYIFALHFHLPLFACIILSMLVCAIFGILIDKIAYLPLRKAPRLSPLISALAVSILIQNIFRNIFGANTKKMPDMIDTAFSYNIGELSISRLSIIIIGVSLVCMFLLNILVKYTKIGRAMRSVSEDMQASELMGINVNRTISITFALGSMLAAVGGILFALAYNQISPMMGTMPGLKAFVAAVIGGIGIIPGAVIGGFIIGIVETFTKAYISTSWADAIVFLLLIIVFIFKPTGILGKNVKEKV